MNEKQQRSAEILCDASSAHEQLGSIHADAFRFALDTVLDGMRANVYVTDPKTDTILYMNKYMKQDYQLQNPEGQCCWRVLQSGLKRRCSTCPVDQLELSDELGTAFEWEEASSKTNRVYRNSDSLIRWFDGSVAHLQQSIDITDVKTASIDELTELLTRRAGKYKLEKWIKRRREQHETFCVCLFDINRLKEVNDTYGHSEGDRVLCAAADAVRGQLTGKDFAFRLSGDEFVCVIEGGSASARAKMERADDELAKQAKDNRGDAGFCFGIVEIGPCGECDVNSILSLADERMYEQKRRLHIGRSIERVENASPEGVVVSGGVQDFEFNQNMLYDALVNSTDDYLYVCNMKTGVFRYSQAMVEEFGLPGQVITDAAAVWGAHVHPEDRQAFLESNQEITDARTLVHNVEYRARNCQGVWVRLRCRGRLMLDSSGDPELFAGFITNLH